MADTRLLLLAQEAGEVATISALFQSAAVRVADVAYDRRARRVVLLTNRYRWEGKDGTRVRSALRIESVLGVARRAWPAGEAVLELLALTLADDVLTLSFAGGATLRVTVECPELVLEDVSAPWRASREPRHD
ncbi:DUF2948 family protein [Glacieibacterium frigidum]|uniref:DUF2948 family protein n=1 Tax=Glacieibacterium frigidum TaxID=2593303 RepID=A0A552U8R7_9SPHN|nr:DUF2948 family protein [Glacieibacterium frigidum]TRW14614.1 DUF2948 family protein [Glacieibacterium frigidum]